MKNKKTLHILRHAKSSWDYENIADTDRPLKLKGIKNAYEMARRIKIRNSLPEYILSSPASRALHTAVIVARVIELPFKNLNIDQSFYGSEAGELVNLIRQTDNTIDSLMVVGHNPDFTNLANLLINEPVLEIPAAGLVTITFSAKDWKDIGKDKVTDVYFDFPKKGLQIES